MIKNKIKINHLNLLQKVWRENPENQKKLLIKVKVFKKMAQKIWLEFKMMNLNYKMQHKNKIKMLYKKNKIKKKKFWIKKVFLKVNQLRDRNSQNLRIQELQNYRQLRKYQNLKKKNLLNLNKLVKELKDNLAKLTKNQIKKVKRKV
jgi:hypothetical protein